MKPAVAIDTNVPIVANGSEAVPTACALACIQKLREVRSKQRVLLDTLGLILAEYRRHLSPRGQPGLGDASFKWLWNNQANSQVCAQIRITPIEDSFMEFPQDADLSAFDPSDRKFVAVILASNASAPLLNATDTDWWHFREALNRHGVKIEFLCPAQMTT